MSISVDNKGAVDFKSIRPVVNESLPKLYIETYGCQMNVNDSEVVVSIMQHNGYSLTKDLAKADLILINTCSIRDNAEQRVWGRLDVFKQQKKKRPVLVGVIGCMAERLKTKLLEEDKVVDIVVGPDAYRDLPNLVVGADGGQKGINVLLSREETYADLSPVRLDQNGVTAFVSIMRGCNNMCTYCVVPYTRGAERSRNPYTILREVQELADNGYKEVTLLGQNVNSYRWTTTEGDAEEVSFANLLDMVARQNPRMRIRYSTSHPRDMKDEVLEVMAAHDNICKYIHLPAQSGNTRMLQVMNRCYTREWYLDRIAAIRRYMPDCAISTDIIAGFCTETEEEHQDTLSLMDEVGYEFAYMFKYSERPNTKAQRTLTDDVPDEVKTRRLNEIIDLQNKLSLRSNQKDIGKEFEVLVEGTSKRSQEELFGRNSQNKVIVFARKDYKVGDFVKVRVTQASSATLKGEPVE
ncbi:tRNA (N6-isopentenyl adenosine(37)-C2)-methylthiotransferase MiaB [uncultured Acetobacteroides sp.]|uniref:tRNA (N6-isopentenyl adenosine(37)-C2)-methylthiotransferase MiaB n=1 Tax=uncultured Acetobacteroides sp. TaxID=1760811 RepID=UPI002AA7600F|nr:tRNA (N6-isopentenyl adenosine(37)-C2)-methylthiotransferase MiaB [uncultured Acetobacteroides sp.]